MYLFYTYFLWRQTEKDQSKRDGNIGNKCKLYLCTYLPNFLLLSVQMYPYILWQVLIYQCYNFTELSCKILPTALSRDFNDEPLKLSNVECGKHLDELWVWRRYVLLVSLWEQRDDNRFCAIVNGGAERYHAPIDTIVNIYLIIIKLRKFGVLKNSSWIVNFWISENSWPRSYWAPNVWRWLH